MPAWVVHLVLVVVERRTWLTARAASVLVLLAAAALSHAAWMVATSYTAHYRLQDRTIAIVRTHAARTKVPGDTPELRSALMHAVRGQGLEAHVRDSDFEIESTVSRLRISCRYIVRVQILPWVTHTFPFRLHVEEPVLPKPETIFI